jgi:hypothetical protein
VGADAGLLRHRVGHEAAHATVAVDERVDVVEPMMSSSHRDDARRRSQVLEPVALLEVRHELRYTIT